MTWTWMGKRAATRLSRGPLPRVRLQECRHQALQGRRTARGLQAALQPGARLSSFPQPGRQAAGRALVRRRAQRVHVGGGGRLCRVRQQLRRHVVAVALLPVLPRGRTPPVSRVNVRIRFQIWRSDEHVLLSPFVDDEAGIVQIDGITQMGPGISILDQPYLAARSMCATLETCRPRHTWATS